jgi:hypothetical protein
MINILGRFQISQRELIINHQSILNFHPEFFSWPSGLDAEIPPLSARHRLRTVRCRGLCLQGRLLCRKLGFSRYPAALRRAPRDCISDGQRDRQNARASIDRRRHPPLPDCQTPSSPPEISRIGPFVCSTAIAASTAMTGFRPNPRGLYDSGWPFPSMHKERVSGRSMPDNARSPERMR